MRGIELRIKASCEAFDAPARIRTMDPLIKSQLLYQLSYWCGVEPFII